MAILKTLILTTTMTILLDGNSLTLQDVAAIAESSEHRVELSADAKNAIERSRAIVEQWVESNEPVYGVTTGFGEFANVRISHEDLEQLQENLILSHSVGAGAWLPRPFVRAMLVLRINALAKGYSGIRLQTLETLVAMLNADIIPAVPEQGSVGSSGDLVQLSHIALAAIGKGRILMADSSVKPSLEVLQTHGIMPIRLQAKEGLAMINGTQMMCAFGTLSLHKALRLAEIADIAGALTTEALRGTDTAFDERLHKVRGFSGQLQSAKNLRELMHGSQIRESHRDAAVDNRVQDAYSLRCMPQVHGASRDAIGYVLSVIEKEINAATDNPLIFPDEENPGHGFHLEGGNFHGQPLALALDFLAIACAELANISERRIERLVNGALSGLPRFLAPKGGLNSGLMIAQYTAASIVSENKVLCHPASVDSIPTSANQEDHNSMGSIAAQKGWRVVQNLERVLAIELLCAAQGIDFLKPLRSSERLEAVRTAIRTVVPFMDIDRVVYDDVEAVRHLVESGVIESAVSSGR
jgi:histidine ammonia-lyase